MFSTRKLPLLRPEILIIRPGQEKHRPYIHPSTSSQARHGWMRLSSLTALETRPSLIALSPSGQTRPFKLDGSNLWPNANFFRPGGQETSDTGCFVFFMTFELIGWIGCRTGMAAPKVTEHTHTHSQIYHVAQGGQAASSCVQG